jgi:hypothetical protein
MGFAVGALWGYLFAPRQGPGFEQMQRTIQQRRPA